MRARRQTEVVFAIRLQWKVERFEDAKRSLARTAWQAHEDRYARTNTDAEYAHMHTRAHARAHTHACARTRDLERT